MPEKDAKKSPKAPKTAKGGKAKSAAKKSGVKIKLVRSVIGTTRYQRAVVMGLGLRRINHTVEREDTPEVRGMIDKVSHLVQILEA
jgi:large subunit ribosomal protein L30